MSPSSLTGPGSSAFAVTTVFGAKSGLSPGKGYRMLVVCWATRPHIPLHPPIPIDQLGEGLQQNPVPFSQHIPLLPDPTQCQGTAVALVFPCPHSALRGQNSWEGSSLPQTTSLQSDIVCFHSEGCGWEVLLDVIRSNLPALAGPPRVSR